MRLYRFKTFRTSYYFPRMTSELRFMFGLYAAYGGLLSKIYWWLFRNCTFVRRLNAVHTDNLPFPYNRIVALNDAQSLMAFNLGTPGIEQKISILGYELKTPFFAKYSENPVACQLTKNEISVYLALAGTGLTPTLLDFQYGPDFCWLKTEYVRGDHPDCTLTDNVLQLALNLAGYHLGIASIDGLKTSLSHGDFCPWNMLLDGDKLRLIDWEMAEERPLGFDLLTFICQVSALLYPKQSLLSSIKKEEPFLNQYFAALKIADMVPYLQFFARFKTAHEKTKGNSILYKKYRELSIQLNAEA